MDKLIYDRSHAVYLNYTDLNRIEEWTAYLRNYLDSVGYSTLVKTRSWTRFDIPWQKEIDRIRTNINKLYKAFHYLPEFKEIIFTNSLNYEQVNVMEWDLEKIYTWLERMIDIFCHSNELILNEGGIA